MSEIRALSVRQPFAWAIAVGAKPVENRTYGTRYRGLLAIHASKTIDRAAMVSPLILDAIADHGFTPDEGPSSLGAVVAVAELLGCHRWPAAGECNGRSRPPCSPWAALDQWHWRIRNARPLPEPVPCRGRTGGLWWLPADVERAVIGQLQVSR